MAEIEFMAAQQQWLGRCIITIVSVGDSPRSHKTKRTIRSPSWITWLADVRWVIKWSMPLLNYRSSGA
ncbi:hypothetical protein NYA22BAC_03282 [Parasphingorhabdus sp. NYA22]